MLAGGRNGRHVRRVEPTAGDDASCSGRDGGKQAVELPGFIASDAGRAATQQVVTDAHQVGAERCESRRRRRQQPLCRGQKRAKHVVSTLMRHGGVQPGEGAAYSICRGKPQRCLRTDAVCSSGSSSSHTNEQKKPRSPQRERNRVGACAAEAAITKEVSLALEQTARLQAARNSEISAAPASSALGCSLITARQEELVTAGVTATA